jgi:hypothetical protein
MKTIIVKWIPNNDTYRHSKSVMIIIWSNHFRFIEGMIFDYGFFNIASEEGFTIISLPEK